MSAATTRIGASTIGNTVAGTKPEQRQTYSGNGRVATGASWNIPHSLVLDGANNVQSRPQGTIESVVSVDYTGIIGGEFTDFTPLRIGGFVLPENRAVELMTAVLLTFSGQSGKLAGSLKNHSFLVLLSLTVMSAGADYGASDRFGTVEHRRGSSLLVDTPM